MYNTHYHQIINHGSVQYAIGCNSNNNNNNNYNKFSTVEGSMTHLQACFLY